MCTVGYVLSVEGDVSDKGRVLMLTFASNIHPLLRMRKTEPSRESRSEFSNLPLLSCSMMGVDSHNLKPFFWRRDKRSGNLARGAQSGTSSPFLSPRGRRRVLYSRTFLDIDNVGDRR